MPSPQLPHNSKAPKEFTELLKRFRKLSELKIPNPYQLPIASDESRERLIRWCELAKTLPKPWPEVVLQKMIHHTPDGPKSCEILRWIHKVVHQKDADVALEALALAFEAGIQPSQYIAHSGVSILGLAAYVGATEAVKLCYQHEKNKESLRLTLKAEHLSRKDSHMIGSTLLHRLVERYDGQVYNRSDFPDIVKIILAQDPEACLQQTQKGLFPHQVGNMGVLATMCHEQKNLWEHHLLQQETQQSYDIKPSGVASKKM